MRQSAAAADLPTMIDHWVASGIITAVQAERIRADVAAVTGGQVGRVETGPRGTSLVTEALGYLGGVIILVALVLVTGQLWDDVSAGAKVGLAGGAAAVLLVAGAGVGDRLGAPGTRLRAVLWLAGSAALVWFLELLATETFGWQGGNRVTLFAAGGGAVVSAGLWWVTRHVMQHVAVLVTVLGAAAAATALLPDSDYNLPGVALWGVGAAWATLAWGGLLPNRRAGVILGATATVIGAVTVAWEPWGSVLAVLTVTALVLAAVATRNLGLLAVASLGTLVVLAIVVDRYFPGVVPTAMTLLAVGVLLIVVAVLTAHRRSRPALGSPGRDWSAGPAGPALVAATAIALVAIAVIVGVTIGGT